MYEFTKSHLKLILKRFPLFSDKESISKGKSFIFKFVVSFSTKLMNPLLDASICLPSKS